MRDLLKFSFNTFRKPRVTTRLSPINHYKHTPKILVNASSSYCDIIKKLDIFGYKIFQDEQYCE